MPWFEAPPEAAWAAAEQLLDLLGGRQLAAEMARYPLHPRLARMIIEARRRGAEAGACRAAAFLSSGVRLEHIDILDVVEGRVPPEVDRVERQMRRLVRPRSGAWSEEALRISLLTAYPDRVGRRRSARDVQLVNGRAATLASDRTPPYLVALEIEDRREGQPLIRCASEVKPEWLIDLYPERITAKSEMVWNRAAERVEARESLLYGAIAIDESPAAPEAEAAAGMLAAKALEAGLGRFTDTELLDTFLARIAFASEHAALPKFTRSDAEDALRAMCLGLRTFAELQAAAANGGLVGALRDRLGPEGNRLLNEVAPERIPLKNRQVRVNYSTDRPPSIASRLQDFFGQRETPRIARGQVSLVVELLAPNGRPVQTTTDLAGFWERLYPQVRRELSRRYPKHAWPEHPL